MAIASDFRDDGDAPLPFFHLDDIAGIADFIVAYLGLGGNDAKLIDDCFVLDKDSIAHLEALAILSLGSPLWIVNMFHWMKQLDAFSPRRWYRPDPFRHTTILPSMAMPSPIPITTRKRAQG